MAEPPEFWTFAATNLVIFVFGAILAGMSYYAYHANGKPRSFRNSTYGFAVLTLGGLVEPVYQLALKGDYRISGRELLAVQTIEGALIAVGLGLLFYSIYRHNRLPVREPAGSPDRPSDTR